MGTGPIEPSQAAQMKPAADVTGLAVQDSTVIRSRARGLALAAGACGKGLELDQFAFHGIVAVIDG
jgi:hypothetical protein